MHHLLHWHSKLSVWVARLHSVVILLYLFAAIPSSNIPKADGYDDNLYRAGVIYYICSHRENMMVLLFAGVRIKYNSIWNSSNLIHCHYHFVTQSRIFIHSSSRGPPAHCALHLYGRTRPTHAVTQSSGWGYVRKSK